MQDWELKPEEIKQRIDMMIWSFSRVNTLSQCPYAWYLKYIEEQEGLPNAYAQFGKLAHEVLEKYLKGELNMFTVSQYYQDRYPEMVTCEFPSNKYVDLDEKAYNQGLDYFNNLDFDFNKYEILGVERELNFKVGEYPFHGFADAIYRDKETGEIILRDHKTFSFKYLKDGSISKSKTYVDHFRDFRRQEYLYCIPLIEEYGKVDYLSWNMIRDQREIKIPFNEEEFKEAQEWCINTIKMAEQEILWLPDNSESYRCNVICDQRGICFYH